MKWSMKIGGNSFKKFKKEQHENQYKKDIVKAKRSQVIGRHNKWRVVTAISRNEKKRNKVMDYTKPISIKELRRSGGNRLVDSETLLWITRGKFII